MGQIEDRMNEWDKKQQALLHSKPAACERLIEEIKNATHMEYDTFDEKTGKRITIKEDIPEGVKELAIKYLTDFSSSKYLEQTVKKVTCYETPGTYRLRYDEWGIKLAFTLYSNLTFHDTYSGIGNFLYGVYVASKMPLRLDKEVQKESGDDSPIVPVSGGKSL